MLTTHLDVADGYVAWSGGKDSTVLAHMASTVRPGVPLVTYVAGTEYPEVLPYCERLATDRGWVWDAIQTHDVPDMLDRGVRPASQGEWWDAMVQGPADEAHRRYGRGLVWGLRADESGTRAVMLRSTGGVRERSDGVRSCAPLWRWSTLDVYAYLAAHGVPLCPVYERMEAVGMPVDARRVGRIVGRRGMDQRMRWLRAGWPETYSVMVARWPWLRI